MVLLGPACYFGNKPSYQQAALQKAPPAPPPAPPKASAATEATSRLIRDIASQRSRSTTVLTRRRDKLIPGVTDWKPAGTALTQNVTPLTPMSPPPTSLPPPPLAPPGPGMPAPVTGTITGTNPGSGANLGPQVGGPGGTLDTLMMAVNSPSATYGTGGYLNPEDTSFGYPVHINPGVDEHITPNGVTEYLL